MIFPASSRLVRKGERVEFAEGSVVLGVQQEKQERPLSETSGNVASVGEMPLEREEDKRISLVSENEIDRFSYLVCEFYFCSGDESYCGVGFLRRARYYRHFTEI